ncbi:MAG: metalloregulator ArsR/SmtB family transcription factor [Myxococcaceae bacterium]|nr:metalloregulator ArsR/SmtB family transcription factor [Myxococcaceae bacterium]
MRSLDATFAALADPTRRSIVARLAQGDATVNELAAPFDISLPAISRHLKVLEQAGLIARERDANRRPCSLVVEALTEVTRWAEDTRREWEERFDRLDAHLREVQAHAPSPAPSRPTKEKHHDRKQR